MPKPRSVYQRRSLLSFSDQEIDQLREEARARGLALASYLRSLVLTHPDRRPARVKRAG